MRWNWSIPKPGDRKTKRKFLLIPRTMRLHNGTYQTRWLCWTRVVFRYEARDRDNMEPWIWRFQGFEDELLLDKVEGKQ